MTQPPSAPKRRLGIVSAPGWIDPNLPDLERVYPGALQMQQTILPPPGFDYSFASIAASEPHLVMAAMLLAEAGCEFIIQDGPGFGCLIGGSPEGARAAGQRIGRACGVPVKLNAVALLDELGRLAARHYQFTKDEVRTSLRKTRAAAPDAEALLITGTGIRTLGWLGTLQNELGLPLIAADDSLRRAVGRRFGLPPAD